jgi:hypothetical protein
MSAKANYIRDPAQISIVFSNNEAMALRHGKQIGKPTINGIKKIEARDCPRQNGNAAGRGGDNRKFVSGNLLGPRYQSSVYLAIGTARSLN